jgi:hypothetical protein
VVLADAQVLCNVTGHVAKGLRTARRKKQRWIRQRAGYGPATQPPDRALFLATRKHRVSVGAAEPERAHTDDQTTLRSEGELPGDWRQVPAGDIDVRIDRAQMKVRRNAAITQHVHRFEEPRHACCSLEVSDVAFDRPDGQWSAGRTVPP